MASIPYHTHTFTVPTATQAEIEAGTETGKVIVPSELKPVLDAIGANSQPISLDLTTISELSPTNDDVLQRKANAWVNRTITQYKTDLALTKADVGLSNADNTADADKPASTATLAAQTAAESAASAALVAGQFYATVGAGEGATSDGDLFWVKSATTYSAVKLYKNVLGTGTYQGIEIASKALWDYLQSNLKNSQIIGRPTGATLVTGSGIGNSTFVQGGDPFLQDVISFDYTYFGLGVGTAYFSVWSKSGTTYTFQGEVSFTTATGLQTVSIALPATAGWVPGIYASTLIAVTTADADGMGNVAAAGHNTTNFTDSSFTTGTRIQHRIKAYYQSVTETRVSATDTTVDGVLANLEASTVIGRPTGIAVADGSAISNNTFVHKLAPLDVAKKLRIYDYYGKAVGTARLIDFSISGDTMTPVREYSFITATGAQAIYPDWDVPAGHVVGVYAYDGAGLIAVSTATGDSDGYVADTGHTRAAFTSTTVVTAARLQHRFTFGAQSVTEIRVAEIEDTANSGIALVNQLSTAVIAASGSAAGAETLGAFVPVTGDGAAGAGTYMLGAVYAGAADRTIASYFDQIKMYTTGAGGVDCGIWERDENTSTNSAVKTVNLTWAGSGSHTFTEGVDWDADYFALTPGQYFGFYNDGTIKYLTAPNAGYYQTNGLHTSFVKVNKNSTALEIQAHASVRYSFLNASGEGAASPLPTTFDLILQIGQSNDLGTATDYGATPQSGTAYMWRSASGTLVPLADPTGNLVSPNGSMGPAFATEYFARTGRGVILVNMSRGGSSLVAGVGGVNGDWSPTGTLRQAAIDALNACKTYLDANGYAYQMAGVMGVSMESDAIAWDASTVTSQNYADALAGLRTFLETGTGMGSKMPWIIPEIGTLATGNSDGAQAIRAEQRTFCRGSSNTWLGWIGAKNLEARDTAAGSAIYMEADHLHYTQLSQTERGKAFAAIAAVRFAGLC